MWHPAGHYPGACRTGLNQVLLDVADEMPQLDIHFRQQAIGHDAPDRTVHIWPRGGFMLIALPNPGGDFTLTLFLPNKGETSFEALGDEQAVMAFFETHFPEAMPLIPDLAEAVINHPLGEHGSDWANVFARFEAEQLANANAIADMALDNYIEMRDTVRDAKFALRKQLAFELEKRLPDAFIPRYSTVMFHADIPYLVAQ